MRKPELFIADEWRDYKLLDCGNGSRLEQWGKYTLIRPDPQVLWPESRPELWNKVDAVYKRSKSGGGKWEYLSKIPESWTINYKNIILKVQPTGFKHTGIFPEQAYNWDRIRKSLSGGENVLNLFGYTGAATVASALSGASVVHVDASKGALSWCRENAAISGIPEGSIRLIPEDCLKFVERETRRGKKYDAIIMDPPSFGRGSKGEVWKLEDDFWRLLKGCSCLLSENAKFLLINSYTSGISPLVAANMVQCLNLNIQDLSYGELALPFSENNMYLPCGISLWAQLNKI